MSRFLQSEVGESARKRRSCDPQGIVRAGQDRTYDLDTTTVRRFVSLVAVKKRSTCSGWYLGGRQKGWPHLWEHFIRVDTLFAYFIQTCVSAVERDFRSKTETVE